MAWRDVRGPIGPERWDFYASFIAMHAGGPYNNPREVTIDKFGMPWNTAQLEAKARAGK